MAKKYKHNNVYYINEKSFFKSLSYKWLTCHPVKDTKSDNVTLFCAIFLNKTHQFKQKWSFLPLCYYLSHVKLKVNIRKQDTVQPSIYFVAIFVYHYIKRIDIRKCWLSEYHIGAIFDAQLVLKM